MDNFTYILLFHGFLLLFVTKCQGQGDVKIDGAKIRAVEGMRNVLFTCQATGLTDGQDPQLKWFNEDGMQILPNSQDKHMKLQPQTALDKLTLLLQNVTMEMAGVYRCKGMIGAEEREDTVQLEVSAPIITTGIKREQSFIEGEDVVVLCSLEGPFDIAWTDNRQNVVTADNKRMQQLDTGLSIKNITTADSGMYMCSISTLTTFEDVFINVIVMVPPVITQSPSRQEAITGASMRMECRATGIPEPKYQWFKLGQTNALVDGDRFTIDAEVGSFIINEVIEDDEGIYRCLAFNDAGNAQNEAELDVLIPPSIRELNNYTANEGTSVTLRCLVSGDPLNSVTWRKGDIAFSPGNQDVEGNSGDSVSVKTNVRETDLAEQNERLSELTINNLERDDAGVYECHADGGKSGTAEGNSILTVRYKPVFAKDQAEHNYTWAGQTGVLRCTTLGEPLPDIRWYRDDMLIETGQSYFDQTDRQVNAYTREGLLMMRVYYENEQEVYTTYTCEASNDMGTSRKNISLIKSSVPVLSKVSRLELTPTTVTYSIEVGSITNGPPPTHILVEYGNGNALEVALSNNGPTIVNVTKLTVNTPYEFHFYAKSEAGQSAPKVESFTTLAMREPYPVQVMSRLESDYATKYLLQWTIPKTGGSPIQNIIIRHRMVSVLDDKTVDNQYQFKNEMSGWTTVPKLSGGTTTKTIDGLRPDQYYQVEVTAVNVKGSSEPKPFIFHTAKQVDKSALEEDLGLPIGIIILIVIVVFVVLFVIVDVTCYFRNKCGVIMCLKERVGHAGSADTRSKEPIMESGESEKKVPLLDSEGGAKDEVEEENEVAGKEEKEFELDEKPQADVDIKPVPEGEEAKDDTTPAPDSTEDPLPPPQVATTPPASDGPAELPVATEPSA